MKLPTSLTSITFRQLDWPKVLEVTREAGIDAIEWGGDVHVPPGDPETAKEVLNACKASGVSVSAYGSYDRSTGDFAPVLSTAKALETSLIRIWAGPKGSAETSPDEREDVTKAIRSRCEQAEAEGIIIGLEYHGGTLTDTLESALDLFESVNHQNLRLFWQPRVAGTPEGNLRELRAVFPHLGNIHLFHWGPGGHKDRRSLEEGRADWTSYLKETAGYFNKHTAQPLPFVTFEFVREDSPSSLMEDAAVLRSILDKLPVRESH